MGNFDSAKEKAFERKISTLVVLVKQVNSEGKIRSTNTVVWVRRATVFQVFSPHRIQLARGYKTNPSKDGTYYGMFVFERSLLRKDLEANDVKIEVECADSKRRAPLQYEVTESTNVLIKFSLNKTELSESLGRVECGSAEDNMLGNIVITYLPSNAEVRIPLYEPGSSSQAVARSAN